MSVSDQPKQNIIQAVRDYGKRLFYFIRGRVNTDEDAEDILQDVWYQFSNVMNTEPIQQTSAWLYRVAHNATADYWRAFYRLPVVGVDHVAPGWEPADESGRPQPEPDERAGIRVQALLRRLPDHYRRVLELRLLERKTVAETAVALGISNGNARVLQYRALRRAALLGEPTDG
jgi:RNA polymerase sigma factor (sigma-70 family)